MRSNSSNPLPLAQRPSMRARWPRVLVQDSHRTVGVDMSLRAHIFLSLLWSTAACSFPRPADVPEPISCTANDFIGCDGSRAQTCNATGDGAVNLDCGVAGCNVEAKRCNQCVPKSDSCGPGTNAISHCDSNGLPTVDETCALACVDASPDHCAYLEPRYLPDVCDVPATMPTFDITGNVSFDTGLDINCNGGTVHQDGAADICVVRYDMIHIAQSVTLQVSGTRALALVADRALVIDGTLDVAARGPIAGPGGGSIQSGDPLSSSSGGGGAGFATAGAAGGSTMTDGGGGAGGSKVTNPFLLAVLIGGSQPARAVGVGPPLAGGAGGAATLIACRGQVSVTGILSAGGGGGEGGRAGVVGGTMFAGAGGGSGGNIILQALSIVVTGQVYANGGGGGAGWVPGGPGGQAGAQGAASPSAAPGGAAFSGEGAGGAGGWRDAPPSVGSHPTASGALPGGGGASVGFFQSYTPVGVSPILTPSGASPTFSPNRTINTR